MADNRPWYQRIFDFGGSNASPPIKTSSPITSDAMPAYALSPAPMLGQGADKFGVPTGNKFEQPGTLGRPAFQPTVPPAAGDIASPSSAAVGANVTKNGGLAVPTLVGMPMPVISPPTTANVPLPPRRPDFANLPAPGAHPAGPAPLPAPPAAAPSPPPSAGNAGPGYEYYQTQDDNGRIVWGTRPKGFAGALSGQGTAAPQFQNGGTGLTLPQAQAYNQQSPAGLPVGARPGQGIAAFLGNMSAPPGGNGPSIPPGANVPLPPERPAGLGVNDPTTAQNPQTAAALAAQPAPGQVAPGALNSLPPQMQAMFTPAYGSPIDSFLKLFGGAGNSGTGGLY